MTEQSEHRADALAVVATAQPLLSHAVLLPSSSNFLSRDVLAVLMLAILAVQLASCCVRFDIMNCGAREAARRCQIATLPSRAWHARHEKAGQECALCIAEFEERDLVTTLECGHAFHTHCITRWMLFCKDKQRTCPMCRADALPLCGANSICNAVARELV